jgi:lysophospholipase L1-like esterase
MHWWPRARLPLVGLLAAVALSALLVVGMAPPPRTRHPATRAPVLGTMDAPLYLLSIGDRLTLGFTGYERQPATMTLVRATTDARQHILFVGDSLTLGFAASAQANTYAARVVAAQGAVRIGQDSQYGISAITVAAHLAKNEPLPRADAVVIELGTNDHQDETGAAFASAYQAIVDAVRATSPHARLVCLGPWQPEDGPYPARWRVIQQVCASAGGVSVSLFALWRTWSLHGPVGRPVFLRGTAGTPNVSDWFHPNDAGHAAIAQAVLAALALARQSGSSVPR